MYGPLNVNFGKYSRILKMTNTPTVRNIVVMVTNDKLKEEGNCGNENQGEKVLELSLSLINAITYLQEMVITNSSQKIHDVFVEW